MEFCANLHLRHCCDGQESRPIGMPVLQGPPVGLTLWFQTDDPSFPPSTAQKATTLLLMPGGHTFMRSCVPKQKETKVNAYDLPRVSQPCQGTINIGIRASSQGRPGQGQRHQHSMRPHQATHICNSSRQPQEDSTGQGTIQCRASYRERAGHKARHTQRRSHSRKPAAVACTAEKEPLEQRGGVKRAAAATERGSLEET